MIKDIQARRKYAREWMAARRATFFKDKYCTKCGSDEQLELDHIDPTTKEHHCIWSWTETRRNKELAKCQVLCHTCHLDKTKIDLAVPIICGKNGYWHGCRCNKCRRFSADYKAKRRVITGKH